MPKVLQKGVLEQKFRADFCGKTSFCGSFLTYAELLCKMCQNPD